ncbi:unnamed protein product [Orchesella dallaii]|uniref:Uncharacterized protein n=1 Tax=Orchesella dallaii TaxID=48710 RepID=A0ABP1RM28_9HEXA
MIIKLQALCTRGSVGHMPLTGYKLAFMKPPQPGKRRGKIVGVINLQNHRVSSAGYLTVGGKAVIFKAMP